MKVEIKTKGGVIAVTATEITRGLAVNIGLNPTGNTTGPEFEASVSGELPATTPIQLAAYASDSIGGLSAGDEVKLAAAIVPLYHHHLANELEKLQEAATRIAWSKAGPR